MIMTNTWIVFLLIRKLKMWSVLSTMLYQSEIKQAYLWLLQCCSKDQFIISSRASNCNTSSRGEGGGVTQSFNKKGYYSQRYPRSRFFSTSISVYFLTCRLFNLFWVMNILKKLEIISFDGLQCYCMQQ